MEGRNEEGEGGEERSLVAHGDREGLLMDEPWLLIRSDLWWVRTAMSGTILLRFSRRGTAKVLLGTTRFKLMLPLSRSAHLHLFQRGEQRSEGRGGKPLNGESNSKQSGLH